MYLYVLQNDKSKYFRAKGYGGSGDTWVETLEEARLYSKLKVARA